MYFIERDTKQSVYWITSFNIIHLVPIKTEIILLSLLDPITIIMEYVPYGDLLGYMRTSRGLHDEHYKAEKSRVNDLGSAELMSFAEQIASAMAHLERHKVSNLSIYADCKEPYYTIPYHTIPYHTIPYHVTPPHTIRTLW